MFFAAATSYHCINCQLNWRHQWYVGDMSISTPANAKSWPNWPQAHQFRIDSLNLHQDGLNHRFIVQTDPELTQFVFEQNLPTVDCRQAVSQVPQPTLRSQLENLTGMQCTFAIAAVHWQSMEEQLRCFFNPPPLTLPVLGKEIRKTFVD